MLLKCFTRPVRHAKIQPVNTTLTLQIDDQLRQKVRHVAADEKKTVSAWVAELIERTLDETDEYEQNRRPALLRLETGFSPGTSALEPRRPA